VQIVLTKIDKIKGQGELIRITADTARQMQKYSHFVNPEIHITCSDHFFGIKELRARIGTAFEDDNPLLKKKSFPNSSTNIIKF
jgi:GTP-binding protein EngB required for normal cell division